jgi:acyl carrier protein
MLSEGEFLALISEATRVDLAEAPAVMERPLEELGLDSLALTELAVALIVDLEMTAVADDLPARDWRDVTLGEIYDEYRAEKAR